MAEPGRFLVACNDLNKACPGGNHYHNLERVEAWRERGEKGD